MGQPPASPRSRPADPARNVALRAIARQVRLFPDLDPEGIDDDRSGRDRLTERDAAFAHAIYHAVILRWYTLAAVLNPVLDKRPLSELDPPVAAALLGGLAQVMLLDRVPVHAAIDTSVEWIKRAAPPAAGLVNAALRRACELVAPDREPRWDDSRSSIPTGDGRAVRLRADLLSPDPIERWASAVSLRPGILRRWRDQFGSDAARALALHSIAEPPVIINALHAPEPPARRDLIPHDAPGFYAFTGERGTLRAALRELPGCWVQDSASARPVLAAPDPEPSRIIDLCAGRGTKTRQLLARFPNARVLATDADPARLEDLTAQLGREPRLRVVPLETIEAEAGEGADLVLVDAPCSNSGVLPRRPEARYRLGPELLARLTAVQDALIARAATLCRPGGGVLYATCSVEAEENRARIAHAASTLGLVVEREELTLPRGLPGDGPSAYSDASFAAFLRVARPGGGYTPRPHAGDNSDAGGAR